MATIDTSNSISLEPIVAEASLGAGAAANGQQVVARVVAVLSETVARLSVFGHSIEVTTPPQLAQQLTPGSTLKLDVQQNADGQTVFVAHTGQDTQLQTTGLSPNQSPIQSQSQNQNALQSLTPPSIPKPDTASGIVSPALSHANASIIHAILDGGFASQQGPPQFINPHAAALSEENTLLSLLNPALAEQPTNTLSQQGQSTRLADNTASSQLAVKPDTSQQSNTALSQATAVLARAAPQLPTASEDHRSQSQTFGFHLTGSNTAAAEQSLTSAFSRSFTVPVFLPQGMATLQFHVMRHDVDQDQHNTTDRTTTAPSWSMRFAVNAEPLGPVEAFVHLREGKVSVRLWAERSDTAREFKRESSALASAISNSDLTLEDLSVAQGPADDGHQGSPQS